uniref:Uncharacterized protein n=2 Tax=gambiae species complex TaxID=44542 RepID=A0A8W7Q213_ANOCL
MTACCIDPPDAVWAPLDDTLWWPYGGRIDPLPSTLPEPPPCSEWNEPWQELSSALPLPLPPDDLVGAEDATMFAAAAAGTPRPDEPEPPCAGELLRLWFEWSWCSWQAG